MSRSELCPSDMFNTHSRRHLVIGRREPAHRAVQAVVSELRLAERLLVEMVSVTLNNVDRRDRLLKSIAESISAHQVQVVRGAVVLRELPMGAYA